MEHIKVYRFEKEGDGQQVVYHLMWWREPLVSENVLIAMCQN